MAILIFETVNDLDVMFIVYITYGKSTAIRLLKQFIFLKKIYSKIKSAVNIT